jgi:hypothetical protein
MKAKILSFLFLFAAFKGCLIGAYHLYLPTHWQWEAGLTETPEILRWSLFALNDMWSIMILLAHAALLISFRKGNEARRYHFAVFLAVYWFIHGLIIFISPMPMPPKLQWMLDILTLVPFLQALMLLIGAWYTRTKMPTDGKKRYYK